MICNTCKNDKGLNEFRRRAASVNGYMPDCKTCTAIKRKEYYEREQVLVAKRKALAAATPKAASFAFIPWPATLNRNLEVKL